MRMLRLVADRYDLEALEVVAAVRGVLLCDGLELSCLANAVLSGVNVVH